MAAIERILGAQAPFLVRVDAEAVKDWLDTEDVSTG
jgi:hypothetical protein